MNMIITNNKEERVAPKLVATLSVIFVVLLMTCEFSAASERLPSNYSFESNVQSLDANQPESTTQLGVNADVVPSSFIQPAAETQGWVGFWLAYATNGIHLTFNQIRAPPPISTDYTYLTDQRSAISNTRYMV